MAVAIKRRRQAMTLAPASWAMVGRDAELEAVQSTVASGTPVLIFGAAGVGKSRLVQETVARFGAAGATTHWVQATRGTAELPLGALAHLIPADARVDDAAMLMRRTIDAIGRDARRQVVVGVDDAQWLDPASAAVVLQLAATRVASIVATVRSGERYPDAIAALWKDAGGQRLDLEALSDLEAERLIEEVAGGPVELVARRWIADTSGGNALYVRELVLGARSSGAMQQQHGVYRMPDRRPVNPSLLELVAERLTGLDDSERHAVELLALGEPLLLAEIERLADADAIARLQGRGLIVVAGVRSDSEVRLAHPLHAEVVRSTLPSLQARELRLALVDALRARLTEEPQDTLRAARWLLDAGEPVPRVLALRAGGLAIAAGDPELGATLAREVHARTGEVQAALLLARADTARRRFSDAAAALVDVEPQLRTPELALEYLERQSEILHWGLGRPEALRELLGRARAWWPDPAWERRLEALRLRVISFERLGAGGAGDAAPVGASEPASSDETVPVRIANLFYGGFTADALSLARTVRPALPTRTLGDTIVLSLWSRIILETGEDWPELERWMTEALSRGVRLADVETTGSAAYWLGSLRFAAGRYLDARALLIEAESALERHDPAGLLPTATALQVGIGYFTEDVALVRAALARGHAQLQGRRALGHQLPYTARADAWAAAANTEPDRAQSLLLDAAAELASSPVHAARLLYDAIGIGARPRLVSDSLKDLANRCDARLVGLYARHVTALVDDDGAALLTVANELAEIGALRYAAEAAAHAADAFAREGRQDSARRAAARSRALTPAGQLGFAPPIRELDPAAVSLTRREQQIVKLAAGGLTNAQVAERLVLSVRTIESHLYRAMQKLGVDDRRDL